MSMNVNSNYNRSYYKVEDRRAAATKEAEQDAAAKEAEETKEAAKETTTTTTNKNNSKDGFVNKNQYKPDPQKVASMKADLNTKMSAFNKMVSGLFQKQGLQYNNAMWDVLQIDSQTRADAQDAISEDGYWGVEATADRIYEFALGLSGGDPEKAATLRDAVKAGFKSAEEAWGGKLPGICQQTYDRVMEKFDQWEKSGNDGVQANSNVTND